MTNVAVPDGVTRKTARELREALGKVIPDHAVDVGTFNDRAQYAFLEFVAALDGKGIPRDVALESAAMMVAQILASERARSAGDELRELADIFDERYADPPGSAQTQPQIPVGHELAEADIKQLDDVLQRLYPSSNTATSQVRATHHVIGRLLDNMHRAGTNWPGAVQTAVSSVLDYMCRSMTIPVAASCLRHMADRLESSGQTPPAPTTRH